MEWIPSFPVWETREHGAWEALKDGHLRTWQAWSIGAIDYSGYQNLEAGCTVRRIPYCGTAGLITDRQLNRGMLIFIITTCCLLPPTNTFSYYLRSSYSWFIDVYSRVHSTGGSATMFQNFELTNHIQDPINWLRGYTIGWRKRADHHPWIPGGPASLGWN